MKFKEIFLSCSSSSSSRQMQNKDKIPLPKKPSNYTYSRNRASSGSSPFPSYKDHPLLNRRVVWLREEASAESGVVRWIGEIDGEEIAGVVFDAPLGLGSGYYKSRQLFSCPQNRGGLVAVAGLILQEDYLGEEGEVESLSSGSLLSSPEPVREMPIPQILPPLREEDAERINGRSRGIQGNRNSCYLDATLFSMFSFSSVFDSILLESSSPESSPSSPSSAANPPLLCSQVQSLLLSSIINPLRKHLYCPSTPIMRLRSSLEHLDPKLTSEEMDPQEFLQILFGGGVLRLREFISLTSDSSATENSDFFHQVIAAGNDGQGEEESEGNRKIPSIQHLFEQSLFLQGLKLKGVPRPALILLMPRSGNKYKMFDGIVPNLEIDLTDLLSGEVPRCCIICGSLATYECGECYGKFTFDSSSVDSTSRSNKPTPNGSSGAESTSFCDTCVSQIHKRRERQSHLESVRVIKYAFPAGQYFPVPSPQQGQLGNWSNPSFYGGRGGSSIPPPPSTTPRSIPRVTMDLFAVICIETSHFVSFVKCGTDRKAPWIFFDSMADRVENANGTGQNVPQVRLLPKMGEWLEELEEKSSEELKTLLDTPSFPTDLKRLISDPYICFYYSKEAAMYC